MQVELVHLDNKPIVLADNGSGGLLQVELEPMVSTFFPQIVGRCPACVLDNSTTPRHQSIAKTTLSLNFGSTTNLFS